MYSISLIDRTNLGLAFVAGMEGDLGLDVGNRYTVIVMVFFMAYIVFEIPSNIILPKAGAANWLAFLGVSFGAILIGMGFTYSWVTMTACRALFGCTYLITCWYKRFDVGKRLAAFWLISVVLNAFAAIFAYALTLLEGTHGLNGWRWIFIVEGAITVGVCAIGWLIIIDFPTKADEFQSPEEKRFVIDRIYHDRGDAEEDPLTAAKILHHLKDWKLYFWAFNLMASTLPGYAYSYFKTIILTGMGLTGNESQLLSAPPYIVAAAATYFSGRLTDRCSQLSACSTAYGQTNGARYFGVFMGVGFLQFCIPGVLAFQANNITSHSKRAVASATCLIGGGLGGIIASVAFKSSESPFYTTGIWVTFGVTMVSICMNVTMNVYFWKVNKKTKATGGRIEGRIQVQLRISVGYLSDIQRIRQISALA
ncbi:major facilitator superfamily domain-containing protein [Aspergillus desertorum]